MSLRKLALAALVVIAVAAPLSATNQYWVKPASTPNTDVKCTGCPCISPTNCSKDKLTIGYPATVGKFVGRFLDSQNTNDYQQPFRTARARSVIAAPGLNRIYFMNGSAVMAYDTDAFFTRLANNENLIAAQMVPVNGWPRPGWDPSYTWDEFLQWDKLFYAENTGSGWDTPVTDGQTRLSSIDYDDQGYVYVATIFFGWGIVKDDLKRDGGLMPSQFQYPMSAMLPTDVNAAQVIVVKSSSGSYYALMSDGQSASTVLFDVTSRTSPSRIGVIGKGILAGGWAKTPDMTRLAVIPTDNSRLDIYSSDGFVQGTRPLFTDPAPAGGNFRGITTDGTNFYASIDGSSSFIVRTYAPDQGGGYHRVGEFSFGQSGYCWTYSLRYGGGYLVQAGISGGGADLRLFNASLNAVTEVDVTAKPGVPYFKNYYIQTGQAGYAAPFSARMNFQDSNVIKRNGHTYLVVTAFGLGDVYELQGSDSLVVRNLGSLGTVNPNRPGGATGGPFYGDPVGFTSTTTGSAAANVTFDFGNPEAVANADANTQTAVTGATVTHRYSGLTAVSSLPVTRTVKATSLSDSSVNGSTAVTLAAPSLSIGLSGIGALSLQSNTTLGTPIVVGDRFVDMSDGSVESHFDTWTIGGTAANKLPSEAVNVGACGAGTLSMTAHYGPYTGTSPSLVSLSDMPIGVSGVQYGVRPFAAGISMAPTGSSITFTSTSRFTADTTVLSAAQLAALQWTWELLDSTGKPVLDATGKPVGGSGTGATIQSLVVAKTTFSSPGMRAHLVITSPTAVTGSCAGLSFETAEAFTAPLNGPDPVINGDCTTGGPPCTWNITSKSGINMLNDGWTYSWSVSPGGGVTLGNTAGATFSPIFSSVGSYTVSCVVSNAIGSTPVSKPVNVTKVSSCKQMIADSNVFISYSGPTSGCTQISGSCSANESVNFVATGYLYDFKCGTHTFAWSFGDGGTASTQAPAHTYTRSGTYTVTLTITNPTPQTVTMTQQVSVGGGVVSPPPPPPYNPPPPPPPSGSCATIVPDQNVFISYTSEKNDCSWLSTTACSTGETLGFDASGGFGYDFTCGTHSFLWRFGDGGTATTKSAAHVYSNGGTYTVTVTITQPSGAQATISKTVTVTGGGGPITPPNPPTGSCPAITPGNNVFIYYLGQTSGCSFVGGQCNPGESVDFFTKGYQYDFSCAVHSFTWNFKDGSDPVTGQNVTHVFPSGGTYNVTVSVTVNNQTSVITQAVIVGGSPVLPPTSAIAFDFTIAPYSVNGVSVPHMYTFTAFPTESGATTTKYKWDFGDGTKRETDKASTTYQFSDGGNYTITLTVDGSTGKVTHTLIPPRRRSIGGH